MADSVARRPHTATGARGLISPPSPILIDCLPLTVLSSPPRTCLHLLTPSTPILPPTSLSQVFAPNRIYHQPSWSLGDSPFIGSPHFSPCQPPLLPLIPISFPAASISPPLRLRDRLELLILSPEHFAVALLPLCCSRPLSLLVLWCWETCLCPMINSRFSISESL